MNELERDDLTFEEWARLYHEHENRKRTWEDTWRDSHPAWRRRSWKASGPYRGRQLVRQHNILGRKGMSRDYGCWYERIEGTYDYRAVK